MKTCVCHCRNCGAHFAGLDAFDKHREGEFGERTGSFEARHCRDPESFDEGVYGSEVGICRISSENEHANVSVWFLARNRARAEEAFG